MKKYFIIACLVSFAIVYGSCKKAEGTGGRASIKGKVYAVNYSNSLIVPVDSGYIGGQKIYIIFGDETAVGANQDTNPDGSFEFQYLRKGKYKVYTFSKTTANHLDTAMIQAAEITDKKQTVVLADFKIKTTK